MDKYNKDELKAPEWLNKAFLEEVLMKNEGDNNVKVTGFNISPATEKGDHFASIMFKISVDYLVCDEPKHISLILKTMPVKDGIKKDLVGGSHAFETEIKMYAEIIPKFHETLRNIGDHTRLGAKMIYSSLKPIKIIIFEDMGEDGYRMVPNRYLEPNEIEAVLKKICRWHAISFKLLKEGDETIKEFKEGVFHLEELNIFFNGSITGFSKLLTDQNIDPVYIKKFENLKEKLVEKCKSLYQLKGDLCVLNHGDFHSKNMMIKTDQNNEIDDLMLVDFQFCITAPLVIDLIYLLYAVLNPHCREQHNEIIYKYHTLFTEILQKLGYKGEIPTLIDIRSEMMLYKEYEVLMIIGFLPFMVGISEKVEIDDEIMESQEAFASFYDRPSYINMAKKILPELLHKGYLD